jgi:hypothetical protein
MLSIGSSLDIFATPAWGKGIIVNFIIKPQLINFGEGIFRF